jgi:hypothetical protein
MAWAIPDAIQTVGIHGRKTDEERQCDRTNRDSANQLLGKAKLTTKDAIDGSAEEWK